MKCMQCGSSMKTRRENFLYDFSGLPITLVGVKVSRCSSCGEYEVSIPKIEELHNTIALWVLRKRSRLSSAEIRFLRSHLGWSGAEFAARMGVASETVSRWEQGSTPMGQVADRLLRAMVLLSMDTEEPLEMLKGTVKAKASKAALRLKPRRNGWTAAAAA